MSEPEQLPQRIALMLDYIERLADDHTPEGYPAVQRKTLDECAFIISQQGTQVEQLTRELEQAREWKTRVIKAAEEAHGPQAFRFKMGLNKHGEATNTFPAWLDQRWVSFVFAEDDAHIGLHAQIESLRAELAALRDFQAQAFVAHPNLDLDIEATSTSSTEGARS